jgi:hypothetical protein
MDIETISFNNKQIPVCISISYNSNCSNLFLIDYNLLKTNWLRAVNNLWGDYFDFITKNSSYFENIFVHNLGSFDGYFLYKALLNKYEPDKVNTIIDDKNRFICINLNVNKDLKICWKDSYRIFSVSLEKLCKSLKISGKTSEYNSNFNSINLFQDENLLEQFKQYSIQDSVCLHNALDILQDMYYKEFGIDITT